MITNFVFVTRHSFFYLQKLLTRCIHILFAQNFLYLTSCSNYFFLLSMGFSRKKTVPPPSLVEDINRSSRGKLKTMELSSGMPKNWKKREVDFLFMGIKKKSGNFWKFQKVIIKSSKEKLKKLIFSK